MIVELLAAAAIGVLFFLPWFGILNDMLSGAEIFPAMRELMQGSDYAWAAYSFLLLYFIPLLALITVICFIALRPRLVRSNFITLCDTTIVLFIALILIGALQAGGDYGKALLDMMARMGMLFWVMLALSVAGLIFVAIAKAVRKPVLRAAEPDMPPESRSARHQ